MVIWKGEHEDPENILEVTRRKKTKELMYGDDVDDKEVKLKKTRTDMEDYSMMTKWNFSWKRRRRDMEDGIYDDDLTRKMNLMNLT